MSRIIGIETSGRVCSAALIVDGVCTDIVEFIPQCDAPMEHSSLLAPYIDQILTTSGLRFADIDAIAVSAGPGSYTGLRIGISTAKGLCFGGEVKLILVDSLAVLVSIARASSDFDASTLLCPMVDARRMEVYSAMYDSHGVRTTEIAPIVVDDSTYAPYSNRNVVIFGSGAQKCLQPMEAAGVNVRFIDIEQSASGLASIAQNMFDCQQFADVAYCEPLYLKEFVGTVPKVR